MEELGCNNEKGMFLLGLRSNVISKGQNQLMGVQL
jgi:hypothetical protein